MPKDSLAAKRYRIDVEVLRAHAAKLHTYTKPNISSYATLHNLPYQRLLRAYKDAPTRSDRKPNNCRLTDAQDYALERYLDAINAIGFGIHHRMIAQQAYALLQETYIGVDEEPPQLGKNWARRWLHRHPKYRRVKSKPMEVQRMLAQQPEALRQWFDQLEATMAELGVQPHDMYNMDETGCRIGVATSQYVYSVGGRDVFVANANNRELVTLVECVNSGGYAIEPMVIIKAKSLMEHWVVDLPDNYLIAVSDTGYSNDQLALAWLKHFNQRTKRRSTGAWRLLLLDGHGSHATKEFIQYAEQQKIQLYALPAHTTHLLQPLDVGCFQPLKWYHGRCLEWASRTGSRDINKADFIATIEEIRRLTFTRSTIQSGWRRTGLSPWAPEVVLNQLQPRDDDSEYEGDRDTPPPPRRAATPQYVQSSPLSLGSSPSRPPPLKRFTTVRNRLVGVQLQARLQRNRDARGSSPTAWTPTAETENPQLGSAAFSTPKTARQFQAQEQLVYAAIREHMPREIAASVIKHHRGVAAMALIAAGLQRDLHHTEAAQLAKSERRKRKRRALEATGGPIYSQDARRMVERRQIDDVARLQQDLAARVFRELRIIANKWKRIRPTIRSHGKQYVKRAATGVTIYRDVSRWQYNHNDPKLNTMRRDKYVYIQQQLSDKYSTRELTTEQTPTIQVVNEVRHPVCPYQALCQLPKPPGNSPDDDAIDEEENSQNQSLFERSASPCPKIESQERPLHAIIADEMGSDTGSSDYESDCSDAAYSGCSQNDWGAT